MDEQKHNQLERNNRYQRRNDFLSLFSDFFGNEFDDGLIHNNIMRTNIKEREDSYTIEVEIPGLNKDQIKLSLKEGYLMIEAHYTAKNDEEKSNYIHYESLRGTFSRSYYVGESIKKEDIKARTENGILYITLPKESKQTIEDQYINIE